jgi:hypothetical protein
MNWTRAKKYCYEVDYNDHFETPLKAYNDILPLLDLVAPSRVEEVNISRSRADHVLYDPYYCNGRTKTLLHQLGFLSAINEERDFYKDILNDTCPLHHTFITNPPYSSNHKKRCIQYAVQGLRQQSSRGLRPKRPFFLLMPNYVATKSYFKEIIANDTTVRISRFNIIH